MHGQRTWPTRVRESHTHTHTHSQRGVGVQCEPVTMPLHARAFAGVVVPAFVAAVRASGPWPCPGLSGASAAVVVSGPPFFVLGVQRLQPLAAL